MRISLYPKLTPHVKAQVSPVPVPWCQREGTFISQPREPVQSTVQVNRKIDHLCMRCCCIFEEKYMGRGGERHKASSPCQSMALSTRWVYALSFSSAEKKSCNYWAFSQLFNVRLQRAPSTKRLFITKVCAPISFVALAKDILSIFAQSLCFG